LQSAIYLSRILGTGHPNPNRKEPSVNATASATPRHQQVQSKIRQISAFGGNARSVCTFLFWLTVAGGAALLIVVVRSLVSPLHAAGWGPDNGRIVDILTSPLTPLSAKVCTLIALMAGIAVWLAALRQLRHLFGNLATGAIYTPENVRRVRNVGLLWLLSAVLSLVIPATLMIANSLADASVHIDFDLVFPSFSEAFGTFIAAGLVLLVSWIMDVGLYEKEHADALRHEAELVI
jgi:hypothetical protein